jgi:ribosomal protein L16 Arg81 hydroxylase
MEFDQVVAPLGRDAFLAKHWEKTWLHLPGPAERFRDLLSWDELSHLLENTRLAPPNIRLSQDGKILETDRYIYTPPGSGNVPRIDFGRLMALLSDGATLVLHGVEEIAPRVRALSESVRDALGARNNVNLYAGWHSQNGFDLHWDPHEVMVLQLHGRKRWQIHAPTQDFPLDPGVPPKPTGAPVWDGMLNPGDVLYLPRGWWHVAHPVNEASMHLTFGIAPMQGLNLVNWMAGRLRANPVLRRNLPLAAADRKAYMAQLRGIAGEALSDAALEEFLREVNEHVHGRPTLKLERGPYDQAAPLTDTSRIRLAALPRLVLVTQGDKVSFNAYSKSYSVPAALQPALALLNDREAVAVSALCATLETDAARDSLKKGLALLADAGVVLVEK